MWVVNMGKLGTAALAVMVLLAVVFGSMGVAGMLEASQPSQAAVPNAVFLETCTTDLRLDSVPNGLSGFTIRVDVPVAGSTSAVIDVDAASFPLQSVDPVKSVNISAVDLGGAINPGDADVGLFKITPCVTSVTVLAMDDDVGNPIFPPDTVLTAP